MNTKDEIVQTPRPTQSVTAVDGIDWETATSPVVLHDDVCNGLDRIGLDGDGVDLATQDGIA